MKIAIYGAGYVGLVTAACFAQKGHEVMVCDIDEKKIALCARGKVPIYEPGLEALFLAGLAEGRLFFTTSFAQIVPHADFHFIAVGTPSDPQGAANLEYVFACVKQIAEHLTKNALIIHKSTVPLGTGAKVETLIADILQRRNQAITFSVISNPEFLKEGSAILDFQEPDRVIVGGEKKACELLWALYQDFVPRERFLIMDRVSAELTKYASNAFLATKISFMNALTQLAENTGADIQAIRQGMALDQRIGPHFIQAGCGFGGSCFPKDLQALILILENLGGDPQILQAVYAVNENQKRRLFQKCQQYFPDLNQKKVAIWGLAFKPGTDDMREAPSIVLIQSLLAAGAFVQAYDPVAIEEAVHYLPENKNMGFVQTKEAALVEADLLVIVTDWPIFTNIDPLYFQMYPKLKVIIDGRNCYSLDAMKNVNCIYDSIGRSALIKGSDYAND